MKGHLALLAAVPFLIGGFAAAEESQPSGSISKLTPPVLDKRQPYTEFTYPEPMNREALVFVAVKLNDKGEVIEATQQEGGFYEKRFVDAAVRIARKMRFVPATLNGVPVEYQSVIPIKFGLPSDSGGVIQAVTRDFREEARKVQTLIEQKDFAGAHFHAQWMMAEKVKLGFEYAILQSTMAMTHARSGNVHRALLASREITAAANLSMEKYRPGGPLPKISARDFLLTKDWLDNMLKLRFALASSQGFYLEAANAQASRQALGYAASDDNYAKDTVKILEALNRAPVLRGHVRIDEGQKWMHDLWFNRFTIRSLQGGSIGELVLACDGYSRVLTYSEGAEWTIPSRWSNCRLRLSGSPGTEFDIIEFREAPDTPPSSVIKPAG